MTIYDNKNKKEGVSGLCKKGGGEWSLYKRRGCVGTLVPRLR